MKNNIRVKINVKGGILSVGDLEYIVKSAKGLGVKELFLGERQNLFFHAHARTSELVKDNFKSKNFIFEIDEDFFPNIVTSYPAQDIFSDNSWLSEGIYQDILNSIIFTPLLKINVVDSKQGFAPLYTGNLNFISSNEVNFWHLYINHPSVSDSHWPFLIYSTEIGRLINILEDILSKGQKQSLAQLALQVNGEFKIISAPLSSDPSTPISNFPNYEGLNRIGDQYWLGLYRRDNYFSVDFLESLCQACQQSKIGKISITTWKSILIKGIPRELKQYWEKILGFHGINIRHSQVELNWQLPDFDKQALRLKRYLINVFHKSDVQTNGIAFTIKTAKMDVAGSVVIERKPRLKIGRYGFFPIYDILYAENFNPNSRKWNVYAVDLQEGDLPYYLMLLCRSYYEQLGKSEEKPSKPHYEKEGVELEELVYECQDCHSLYLQKYGDPVNKIPAGTPFENLTSDYSCPICESGIERYRQKRRSLRA